MSLCLIYAFRVLIAARPNLLKFGDYHPDSRVDLFAAPENPEAPTTKGDLFWLLEALSGICNRVSDAEARRLREEADRVAEAYRAMAADMCKIMATQAAWVTWFNEWGYELLPEKA